MTSPATLPPHHELGDRIRRARLRKKVSQETFAPLVGITRRHLIRIEKGRHRPSDPLLERIAEATGVDLADLRGYPATSQEVAPLGDTFRGGRRDDDRGRAARGRADQDASGPDVKDAA